MKRNRTLWAILFGLPLLLVIPLVVIGAGTYTTGSIDVRVVEKGPDGTSVGVHIPAMVIPFALRCVPVCTIDEVRMEMDDEARQALRLASAVAARLASCPDGVFVDVQSREEVILIEKRSGQIVVFVDTPDETVRCSMPIRTLAKSLDAFI